MRTIADKIAELGGELAPPADAREIEQLEERLGYSLPKGLLELLREHNGSVKETDDAQWRFWPCAEITSHLEYRGGDSFIPDNNDLRALDPTAYAVSLPGRNLILFADSLIDAPTYGVFHSPGHRWHGAVFAESYGFFSAPTWDEWVAAFIDHGEDGLLFPATRLSDQGDDGLPTPCPESK